MIRLEGVVQRACASSVDAAAAAADFASVDVAAGEASLNPEDDAKDVVWEDIVMHIVEL